MPKKLIQVKKDGGKEKILVEQIRYHPDTGEQSYHYGTVNKKFLQDRIDMLTSELEQAQTLLDKINNKQFDIIRDERTPITGEV